MSEAIITELAGPLDQLASQLEQTAGECAIVADQAQRVISEGSATLDALIVEAEHGFQRLRHGYQVTRELDGEQAATVLRGIREAYTAELEAEQARPPRPPMFHLAPLAKQQAQRQANADA